MARQKKLYDNKEAEIAPIAEPLLEEAELAVKPEEAVKPTKTEIELGAFVPKTELGKKVKSGEITSIKQIFDRGLKIREAEIVDKLLPNLNQTSY